jgi:hypothetical protein
MSFRFCIRVPSYGATVRHKKREIYKPILSSIKTICFPNKIQETQFLEVLS